MSKEAIYLFDIAKLDEEDSFEGIPDWYISMVEETFWNNNHHTRDVDLTTSDPELFEPLINRLNISESQDSTFDIEDDNPEQVRFELLKTGRFKESKEFTDFLNRCEKAQIEYRNKMPYGYR